MVKETLGYLLMKLTISRFRNDIKHGSNDLWKQFAVAWYDGMCEEEKAIGKRKARNKYADIMLGLAKELEGEGA